MTESSLKRRLVGAFCFFGASVAANLPAADAAARFAGPVLSGELSEPANQETSGLAASHRTAGLIWAHNDSGGEPVLFAMRPTGYLIGRLRVAGEKNRDWEDIAAFEANGQAWLLIADLGDNKSEHAQSVLHILPEPDADTLLGSRELSVAPTYSIHFRYEDGPRDCESVAVDFRERAIYLLSKRDKVPRLYRLGLAAAAASEPAIARFVGEVSHLPTPHLGAALTGKLAKAATSRPTAMDFAPDGSAALVLTYGGVFVFPRQPGQSWAEALAGNPVKLPPFDLPQAEGACFSADGRAIYVASENTRQILRYDREE